MDKKFILTKDQKTANQLIINGFQLVSEISGVWTFLNSVPKNFNFNQVAKNTYCYSNRISL